jgi:hypothetical protein
LAGVINIALLHTPHPLASLATSPSRGEVKNKGAM